MKTGIYQGILNSTYHAGDEISKSALDKVAVSPAHYRYYKEVERKQTKEFSFGTEAHRLILQPEEAKGYIKKPSTARRSKAEKEEWSEFFSANGANGDEIIKNPAADWDALFYAETNIALLTETDLQDIKNMRDAVMSHPSASLFLTGGVAEQSCYWTDEETGLACRCRPDYQKSSVLVDLKSTLDASQFGFGQSAAKLRYHVQAAFYLDGYNAAGGSADTFSFVVCEKSAPYNVEVYTAEDIHLERGHNLYRKDLDTIAKMKEREIYLGYGDGSPMPLWLPEWAIGD